ncbi:MAG TPA: squalene synthase HpnC [Stellaceae bacterium]|nr:squalene synthase HpnC [Stellaceae bacterium]
MRTLVADPPAAADTISSIATVEAPSGKGRGDENFPVGSWLIRRDLRAHVHAFYRFARNADDIADSPAFSADEKLRRLDRMAAILDGVPGDDSAGDDSPAATAMRLSLATTGTTAQHCHDVLRAFRLDTTKLRYRDWAELMEYCRYSAAPVGRQLLDLHGESRDTWPASDALCAALQVLNHLQDCAEDFRNLDRVYLPLDDLAAAGTGVEALTAPRTQPGLRRVLDGLLDRTENLVATARDLPPRVAARGLRLESAVIVALAARLAHRLRRGDPLATRVKLSKTDVAAAFCNGLFARHRR